MKWDEHCERSTELFGEPGGEYHKWLDQYANGPSAHEHRKVLHHKEGVEIGVMLFGDRARKHLEQHLMDDLGLEFAGDIPHLIDYKPDCKPGMPHYTWMAIVADEGENSIM